MDRSRLLHIQNAYLSALRSSPSASSMISFDLSINRTLSFTTTTEIDQFGAMKLINFVRLIPQFESSDEQDRLLMVKYNLVLLLGLRDVMTFDRKSEMFYDDPVDDTITPFAREKLAHCFRSLFILFYGYEETLFYTSNLCRIKDVLDDDPLVTQLLMLVLLFQQGASIHEQQMWALCNPKKILNTHLENVELLFRYLIHRYSFETATIKMVRLVESIFRLQRIAQRYRETLKQRKDDHEIHPLLKSVLDIS